MKSVLIREQKRYTIIELTERFKCTEPQIKPILRKLKEYGVLKTVKADKEKKDLTDLVEADIEVSNIDSATDKYYYVFTFVGVISLSGYILICYPKYYLNDDCTLEDIKQILKVIEKYNSKEQIIKMYNESNDNGSYNLLALMLYLLNDYHEYGSYSNDQDIIQVNGTGEILWEKTINETFTLISNNRPYYPELLTRKRVNDDYDYFKRLHECILSISTEELENAKLLELFDIHGVYVSAEILDDFGDTDYILSRIEKELNIQFNTRKQLLLKLFYTYISNNSSLNDVDCFSMYGTNSFNLVWEKACASVLDNQLDITIQSIKLPIPLDEAYNKKNAVLKDVIKHPIWTGYGINKEVFTHEADTLIPDIITICESAREDDHNKYYVNIFDAKYYNLQLEEGKPLLGQPGIESITKQYLYQRAYQEFFKDHGINDIKNCFLFPTKENEFIHKGFVSLEFLKSLGLSDIQIWLLPVKEVFDKYLHNEKISIEIFNE